MSDYEISLRLWANGPKELPPLRAENVLNTALSHGAFRLHCLLLLLIQRESWRMYLTGLATLLGVGRRTVARWARELKDCGYLEIMRLRNAEGRFSGQILWQVNEVPQGALVEAWKLGQSNRGQGVHVSVTDLRDRQGQKRLPLP